MKKSFFVCFFFLHLHYGFENKGKYVDMCKKLLIFLGILFFSFLQGNNLNASEQEKKEFNAGEMIMDHITDAHDWHLFSYKDKHVSIPLPIILWHNGKLDIFLSSKFHHGHSTYKGYALPAEGEHKGKIICVDENGVFTGEKPLDFSMTKTVCALFISIFIILLVVFSTKKACLKNEGKAPGKLQSVVEMFILFIQNDIAKPAIGPKYIKFMPYLLTAFLFIFLNNILGLIPLFPGGANVTGNIGVTAVLALFTFVITTINGTKHYWVHMFNMPGVPWWLKYIPLMPIIELISMLTKPVVLMIRLFANVMAGHIIILGFMSLIFIFGNISPGIGYAVSPVSILFGVFMSVLELLVAFIQAYVFTLLSSIYFGMAVEESH